MSIPNRFMCVSRRPLGFVFELLAPRVLFQCASIVMNIMLDISDARLIVR